MAHKSDKKAAPLPVPPERAVAGCFGLMAFAVAIVAGLAVDNPTDLILGRALGAMLACYGLGLIAGYFCKAALMQEYENFVARHPVPDSGRTIDELIAELQQESLAGETPVQAATSGEGKK